MPSTVIKTFEYLPESSTLRITYQSGSIYDYKDVPEKVYKMMRASISKGRFLNMHIKEKYKFKQIE